MKKWIILQIITIPTFNVNKQIDHFKTTFHNLNTLTTYKYIHFKTSFKCPRSIAGVPKSQALPGILITAPPSVCVPDVIGALAVCIQNQKKKGSSFKPTEGTQEAEYILSGFIQTNKQTNKQTCSVFLDVYFVLCLFYLNTCVCVCHPFHGSLRECLRARRFLITAPPSVCVPAVIGALAV